jgi:hypothetical protein
MVVGTAKKPFVLMYRSMNGFFVVPSAGGGSKPRSPFYTSGRTGF